MTVSQDMMPTKTGAEYQGWTIMTNCSAGRNHRGVLLQSKFLNFLFAAEKYQHLMVKKLTYIDMVLLLCFSQKSNWWVSTFVAPLLTAHTQRKAHIDVYWLMFCMGESRLDGHRQSDKLQLCSLSRLNINCSLRREQIDQTYKYLLVALFVSL